MYILSFNINYLFLFTLTKPVRPADLDTEFDGLGVALGSGFTCEGSAGFSSSTTFSTASYTPDVKVV